MVICNKQINDNFEIRELEYSDIEERGFTDVLNQLSPSSKLQFGAYVSVSLENQTRHTIVCIDKTHDKVVATASILIEYKFTRGGCVAAHLEDVVTDYKYRGAGLAKEMVQMCVDIAQQYKAYRITLACDEKVVPFYQKCGFFDNGHTMRYDI